MDACYIRVPFIDSFMQYDVNSLNHEIDKSHLQYFRSLLKSLPEDFYHIRVVTKIVLRFVVTEQLQHYRDKPWDFIWKSISEEGYDVDKKNRIIDYGNREMELSPLVLRSWIKPAGSTRTFFFGGKPKTVIQQHEQICGRRAMLSFQPYAYMTAISTFKPKQNHFTHRVKVALSFQPGPPLQEEVR